MNELTKNYVAEVLESHGLKLVKIAGTRVETNQAYGIITITFIHEEASRE